MGIFNPDNPLNRTIGKIGDVIIINILFIVCCIPIITIGASYTSMYYCCLRIVKGSSDGVVRDFFSSFKQNFKQSTIAWVILAVLGFLLYNSLAFLRNQNSSYGEIFFYLNLAIAILLIIFALYLFPVIATFANNLKQLAVTAFSLCFLHFPKTLLIICIVIGPLAFTYSDLELISLYAFIWGICGFAFFALLASMVFYSIFKKYLKEPAAEEEKVDNGTTGNDASNNCSHKIEDKEEPQDETNQ